MAYTKVWIHAVCVTKNRFPFLTKEVKSKVINHILQNAKTKGIYIKTINGHTEHLHCLFGLNADTSISKTIQLIKGESAFWINKQGLTAVKFEWAHEYYAGPISESHLPRVSAYIENQEEHHRKTNFIEEYNNLIKQSALTILG